MNTFSADSIAVHLSSPLVSDQHNILSALLNNELVTKNFKQDELAALVNFLCSTNDDQAEEMVLRIFLKCDSHILAMFDDDLVPRLLKDLENPVPDVRLYAITNLSIMSENSKQVVETLLRDPSGVSTLIHLLAEDSKNGEIRQQTLFLLLDITKGHELYKLLTFHELVNPLMALLSSLQSSQTSIETGYTCLKILSNLLSEKQAAWDFLQSDAFHSFFDLMEERDFLSFPSRMTAEYFYVIKLLFQAHDGSFSELLMKGEHLNSLLEVVASAIDEPYITHNVIKCLETLVVSESGIGYLVCTHKRLEDIVDLATSSQNNETGREIVQFLCKALQADPRCQQSFCSKTKCVEIVVHSIVSQVQNETYQTCPLQLFLQLISSNHTLQSSLAETTYVYSDYKKTLIAWIVDEICKYHVLAGEGNIADGSNDCMDNRQLFHLCLFRILLDWINGSAIAAEHAKNLMNIISSTFDFFSSETWKGQYNFFTSWHHTFSVLLICNLYAVTHDKKWAVILCKEMKVSRIYGCCDRCLKDSCWAEKVKTNQPVSQFPIDEAFCIRMRAVFENMMNWVSADLAWQQNTHRTLVCESHPPLLNQNQEVNPDFTRSHNPSKPEITSAPIRESSNRGDLSPHSSTLLQQSITEREVVSQQEARSADSTTLIEENRWVNDFASFKLNVHDELAKLHSELAEQKQLCAKHESEVKELRGLIDAMNAFQAFE
ncbi:hypothetical protein XU18_2063 [Perkinsela sp. CCAP 1560/4]|nr:hypothetical protein XU18_2063 [Perkinsela sp. CCAP 1560/4]|eukprot:KNH07531.1 hypothetical protein XU18_2063 [Perkinsela sp. CCAP 1560/4]